MAQSPEIILGTFFDRLFRRGVAEVGEPCSVSLLETQISSDSLFERVLSGRWQWRIDELPGDLAITPTAGDRSFLRELARRFYQCCCLLQFPRAILIDEFVEQAAMPLITSNECQIVAADAICYDGLSLLARIDRAVMMAQSDNNVERATSIAKLSALFAAQLQASPLTVLRELTWPIEFTDRLRLVCDSPVLQREAADYLAFPGADKQRQQHATILLAKLTEAGYHELSQYVLKLRAHFNGEDSAWTRRFPRL